MAHTDIEMRDVARSEAMKSFKILKSIQKHVGAREKKKAMKIE